MPKLILRNPDALSTFDLADYLQVHRRTIARWCTARRLPAHLMPVWIGAKRVWTHAQAEEIRALIRT